MCACRIEEMQQISSPIYSDLEEYLREEESRRNASDPDDIYAQIAQKEKDLVLAAELGKALLERNEELSRANEKLTEEYSHKLEELEQEKHALRRKLDGLEGEYDSRVGELTADVDQLRRQLSEHRSLLRDSETDKGHLVQELSEQNLRLTSQLKLSSKAEEQLQGQLAALRDQVNVRKSSLHDQVSQLELLREEINYLTERKTELERRINSLFEERENLSLSLDESSDRIHMLERQTREQEQQMRHQQREVEQLRHDNLHLQERLETALRSPQLAGPPSLLNEMEISSMEDDLRSEGRPHSHPGSSVGSHMEEDGEELAAVYAGLVRLCRDLRGETASSADSGIAEEPVRVSMLAAAVRELRRLLLEDEILSCSGCQELVGERLRAERMEKELRKAEEELRRRAEEVADLTTKLTIQERALAATAEERDQLRRDVGDAPLAKDQIVKKAWEMRDQAVARKNTVEIELAKTRIDVMHINSQLMEAVQQKVELSQQLEQWQVDMEALIGEQVVKKLQSQEDLRKRAATAPRGPHPPSSTPKSSKIFFWR